MDGNWQYWLHGGFHVSLASVLAKSCKVSVWITPCLLVSVKSYKTISAEGFNSQRSHLVILPNES